MALDPYLARDGFVQKTYQDLLDRFRSNGKLHELPVMLEPQVFFYHRDRLVDAGLAQPKPDWTWQAFSQMSLKLSADAGQSHTYGAAAGSDLWPLMLLGAGDPANHDDHTYRQTLQLIQELRDSVALYFQYKPSPFELFRNGRVGMVLTTFIASSATDFADDGRSVRDLSVIPLPRLDWARSTLLSWADVLAIPTTSEHVDLAWRAVRYLAGNKEDKELAAAGWIPANRDDSAKQVWLQAWHARLPDLQGLQSILGAPSAVLISSSALDRWWSTMSRISFYFLSGRISFEEALSQAMAAKAQLQIASAGSGS